MTSPGLVTGADGVARCAWAGTDPDYVAYHDTEWGRPVHDERRLFEKLCLEGFQAGLSWLTVLRKRPAFREVFADFDAGTVAAFTAEDVERLAADARIIRHRGKIEATVGNARALLAMHADGTTLDELSWSFAEDVERRGPGTVADIPATTPASDGLSAALRARGFRFVGPTTAYAFMQAMGMVNDHVDGCATRDRVRGEPSGPGHALRGPATTARCAPRPRNA